jgi:hypothetical protein
MSSEANASVLAMNGLRYAMAKPLSTTLVRTYKKQYSQRQTYSAGDTIVFDLNVTGQVDPEISYLTFKLTSDQGFLFGQNGACSIIRDIRISSKNGVELDRIQSFNAWMQMYLSHMVDQSKLAKDEKLAGLNTIFTAAGDQIVIPVSWLSGLFRPHVKGQKIPSHLLSGARVEIQLESVGRALACPGVASTTFTVEKPSLVFMEHVVNDNTLKVLTEESANNGLEYVYDRVFTSVETSANAIFNTQIKKAVSQATSVVTTLHDPALQNDVKNISFNSTVGTDFRKFQYRLGSNYFPHQTCDTKEEAYRITESAYDCNRDKSCVSANTLSDYLTKFFGVGVPLKSEHGISSSGLAVNNSATIALEYEGTPVNKIYYTFLTYTALARVFLSQTSVKV